jgi:5-formyltetrahydrofolate cyclo-ligase
MKAQSKKQLRKTLLIQRALLTKHQQQHASRLISKRFIKTLLFLRSRRIAFYFAHKKEIDASLILNQALAMSKECFFPILHPIKHNQMWFGRYRPSSVLKKNYLGILEPNLALTDRVEPWILDLVITPLVGFDSLGNRLGMGGGFYDRTFYFKSNRTSLKPKLIGLAYDFQQLDSISSNTWDVALDMVVTESNLYSFVKFK